MKEKFADEIYVDGLRQFARNGRWGTCGFCPRDSNDHAYPEFCEDTERYDHQEDIDGLARLIEISMRAHRVAKSAFEI